MMITRPIPASAEPLPVIGCGTYLGFDQAPGSAGHAELPGVLDVLLRAGGSVVDSSPMYGRAETTTGELLQDQGRRAKAFVATKVWTRGRESGVRQMNDSMRRLRTQRLDLMQIHNLVDWRAHLSTLRDWQADGRLRYIGITHYAVSAHAAVEAVLLSAPLDFLQINYSVDERGAERRLLQLAADRGVAVIVNRPFGGGGLLGRVLGHPLPGWAVEIGCTRWPQVLLKFVLGQPAVTCTIPGTRKAAHMMENVQAGVGELPGPAFWQARVAEILRLT